MHLITAWFFFWTPVAWQSYAALKKSEGTEQNCCLLSQQHAKNVIKCKNYVCYVKRIHEIGMKQKCNLLKCAWRIFFFFFNDTSTSRTFSNGAKLSQCENARRSLLLWCLDNIVLSPFNRSRTVCVPQGQLPVGGEPLSELLFNQTQLQVQQHFYRCVYGALFDRKFPSTLRHQIIGWLSPEFAAVHLDDWKYSHWRQTYLW